MKNIILPIIFLSFTANSSAQKLTPGTYQFKFCDIEYNKCISTCKVIIKGNKITVYATKKLAETITGTKENDLIEKGILLKQKTDEWIIKASDKNIDAKQTDDNIPSFIHFKKKEFWRF